MKANIKVLICIICLLLGSGNLTAKNDSEERLEECGAVMKEILSIKEGVPQDLLDKAECVAVMPSVKKFALGIGGSYGRGLWFAALEPIIPGRGERQLCIVSKEEVLAFSSVGQQLILSFWS